MRTKKLQTLVEQAQRLTKHTVYCCWVSPYGLYDKSLGCTCGRDEFMRKLQEIDERQKRGET